MSSGEDQDRPIEEILSFPILLSERIRRAVDEVKSFKSDCAEVSTKVETLSQMLRSAVRLANNSTTTSFYDRPVRRVFFEASKNLNRALTLVRKCRRRSIFRRVVSIVSAADFKKLKIVLDASIADMEWLLSIFDFDSAGDSGSGGGGGGEGIVLSLPPIASNDPILSWVWSCIACMHLGQLSNKIEAANQLCSLANGNDRNRKIIAEEGGIPPLLKLLKENSSNEAQIAAANALLNLANNEDRVRLIVNDLGVSIIVQVLANSPTKVQIPVANLVAAMAEHDQVAQEGFARENVIRPLVTLLSFKTFIDEVNNRSHYSTKQKQSIHSIVEINKQTGRGKVGSSSSTLSTWSSHRKDRESEPPELKLQLKTTCAGALWMLARGSVSNSRRLTETKGLLCLAKLIETEKGELQTNCLMTVMEIAAAAESNADLRRSAFKTNSAAAKAVIDQLLRLINESDNPVTMIPSIRAIGSLARTFPARQTVVIGPLVKQLSHRNQEVCAEAAIALGKFTCPENFLHSEHSKTIIEFEGVPPLMKLLRGSERNQFHALVLLCYLAIHAGNSEALDKARVMTALEGVDKSVAGQSAELRELVEKAIYHLSMYHAGVISQRLSYSI